MLGKCIAMFSFMAISALSFITAALSLFLLAEIHIFGYNCEVGDDNIYPIVSWSLILGLICFRVAMIILRKIKREI